MSSRKLGSRPFALFGGSLGLSLAADGLWFVLLAWTAQSAGSVAQASLVMAAGSIPRAMFMLVGGALVDRYGALRLARVSNVLRFVILSMFAVYAAVAELNLIVLALFAVSFGLMDALYIPAVGAAPAVLVDAEHLPSAQGVVQTTERLALIFASALGGMLLAAIGIAGSAAIGAAVLLVSVGVLLAVRVHEPAIAAGTGAQFRLVGELRDGLVRVARDRSVGPIIMLVGVLNLSLSAPVNVGLPRLALANGWGESGFGLLLAAFGVGSALGAIATVYWRPRRTGLWGAALGAAGGGLVMTLPWFSALGAAAVVLVAIGLCIGPAAALLIGLVQIHTPREAMGRTMSVLSFAAFGVVPIGYTVFGALAGAVGTGATYIVFGASCVVAACAAIFAPQVRRATRGAVPR